MKTFRAIGALLVLCLAVIGGWGSQALAQDLVAIELTPSQERVQITPNALTVEGQGDNLRVNTAADADGVRRLMSVRARERGSDPTWLVFALTNKTDKAITRWLTAARYDVIGSGVVWPDLDSGRIRLVTPSVGFVPQKVKSERADIFRITVEPGQTVTYVAELATTRAPRVNLWQPVAYELQVRDRRLFNGIMLGITGLLVVFLTAVFAANHKAIFPSAALVAWCVLGYLCVDFGFWHKLLQLRAEDNAVYRAATEAAMAASLAIFVYAFLRLGSWHGFIRMLAMVWIVAALSLVFVAVLDPRLASTFARLSFGALGGVGGLAILFLAIRGQDRALALVPTWILFLVWLFGATMTLTGKLSGDLVVSSLVAGLTLIVVLLGFTVTQFAFGSMEPKYGAAPSEQSLRSLALEGAGAAVWDWHARREEVKVSPIIEAALGLNAGELSTKVVDFLKYLHPADQERVQVLLWSVQERGEGVLRTDFRLRHADNTYRWFDLEAASVPNADPRSLRCVGLLRDITDTKRAHVRLMHDAVHDNLTGLPNRELFLDRLSVAIKRAKEDVQYRPTVIFIDIDKFKSVNASYGLIVGDSLLLTLAKRLQAQLGEHDTLARIGGDQFAVLQVGNQGAEMLAKIAEDMRRSIRSPIRIAGHDVVLTGVIGIAVYDGHASADPDDNELLKEAEIAMYRAKRKGPDQFEVFSPEMRNDPDERVVIESELRQAIERKQLKVLFQPIIHLPREELSGFEALVRWEHPRRGLLNPSDFVPVAEESDLIVKLGSYVLQHAIEQAARWQKELPRSSNPLFVSVNVSSRQLFRTELIQEIRHIVGRGIVPDGVLRLEVTETLVMENPEKAAEMLEMLKEAGARLALDDFGAGYSSLTYLQRFPFDTIKVDRDLVMASSGSEAGTAIVRSIVALAHELGKQVVGEGVEEPEDASFLRSIGCEYAQGFYYGEPMSERDVSELLKIVRKSERKLHRRGFFRTKPADEKSVKKSAHPQERKDEAPSKGSSGPPAQLPPPHQQQPRQAQSPEAVSPQQPRQRRHPTQPRQPVQPAQQEQTRDGGARPPPHRNGAANGSGVNGTAPYPGSGGQHRGANGSSADADPTVPHFRSPNMRTRRRGSDENQSPMPERAEPHSHQPHQNRLSGPGPGQHGAPRSQSQSAANPPPARNANGQALPPNSNGPVSPSPPAPPTPPLPHAAPPGAGTGSGPPPLPHERGSANGGAPQTAPPPLAGGSGNGNGSDGRQSDPRVSLPDLSKLPPGIAASLGRLAGMSETEIDSITGRTGRKKSDPGA